MIQSLIYGDDCALAAHSPLDIQHMLDCFNKATETYGLKISVQKTEVLFQSIYGSANPSIQLGDNDLRVLDSITYLGSVISNTAPFSMFRYASLDREINIRLQKAVKSFGALND